MRRNYQCRLLADAQPGDPFIPSFNHTSLAKFELEHLTTVERAVEFLPTAQQPGIVNDNRFARARCLPGATSRNHVNQPRRCLNHGQCIRVGWLNWFGFSYSVATNCAFACLAVR